MEVEELVEVLTAFQRGDIRLVRANSVQIAFEVKNGRGLLNALKETVEWSLRRRVQPVLIPDGEDRDEVIFWVS